MVDLWLGRRHYQQLGPLNPGIGCVEGVEGTTLEVGVMYPPPKLPLSIFFSVFIVKRLFNYVQEVKAFLVFETLRSVKT